MKKILALVLALVMTMSLATISSGAAYSDADSIRYADAVNTLTALGVVQGTGTGFNPAGDVTRGAAAKMVAMVATASNTTTIGYYAGTATFSDVPATHTFADVVAYCVGKGIVDGYGDGTYGVKDNVKGWAVAKMVLVAMGYDAEVFGLTGTGAALRTIELATANHLFDGMESDFVATAAASREECAQIVYNALSQPLMVEGGAVNGSPVYSKDDKACLMQNYNEKAVVGEAAIKALSTGIVVANGANTAGATTTTLDNVKTGAVLAVETGLDMIGHKVAYLEQSKDASNNVVPYALVDLSSEIAVADGDVKMKAADFKALFGADKVEDDSVVGFADYELSDKSGYSKPVADEKVVDGTYVFAGGKIVAFKAPATFSVSYVSADVKAGTDKENGNIQVGGKDYAVITVADSKEVTKVSYYADIAKDDIVIVTKTGDMTTLTKAASVTGAVSEVETGTVPSITIAGKAYAQSTKFTSTSKDLLATGDLYAWDKALGNNVVAYLDASGAVFALAAVADADTSVDAGLVYMVDSYKLDYEATYNAYGQLVTAAGTNYFVQAIDMTGKEVSYQVALACADAKTCGDKCVCTEAAKYDAVGYAKGELAMVTLDTDEYGVTYATFSAADPADYAWKIVNKAAKFDDKAIKVGSDYYASDVKTLYVDAGKPETIADLKVEVKAGIPAGETAVYYAVFDGSNYEVKYVVVAKAYVENTTVTGTDLVYATADGAKSTKSVSYINAEGKAAVAQVYNVYVNGVLTEVKVADAKYAPVEGFNTYSVDSATGFYSFEKAKEGFGAGEATNLYGTLLTVGELADKEAKDAKIVDLAAAADSTKTPVTALADLLGTKNGASVAVAYTKDANGVITFNTIYVIAQAANK